MMDCECDGGHLAEFSDGSHDDLDGIDPDRYWVGLTRWQRIVEVGTGDFADLCSVLNVATMKITFERCSAQYRYFCVLNDQEPMVSGISGFIGYFHLDFLGLQKSVILYFK